MDSLLRDYVEAETHENQNSRSIHRMFGQSTMKINKKSATNFSSQLQLLTFEIQVGARVSRRTKFELEVKVIMAK